MSLNSKSTFPGVDIRKSLVPAMADEQLDVTGLLQGWE